LTVTTIRPPRAAASDRLQQGLREVGDKLAETLPPRPKRPSIPGLRKRVPKRVPGLEDVGRVYSLTLSADMCTIVYSGAGPLYVATREDVSDPFGEPRLITSCDTPRADERPALSPDGLEMIYASRDGSDVQFLYTSRETRSGEFGEPVPWDASSSVQVGDQLMWPRFIDQLRVTFTVLEVGGPGQWIFMSQRAERNSPFAPPQELPVWKVRSSKAFYSADGLRAYFGGAGLTVAVRDSENEPFGANFKVLDRDLTGLMVNAVWLAPQEDVVFYLSPGPGKELKDGLKLWMVRF